MIPPLPEGRRLVVVRGLTSAINERARLGHLQATTHASMRDYQVPLAGDVLEAWAYAVTDVRLCGRVS